MRCEMQNFIKFSKSSKKVSNVGQSGKPPKRDDWKRERKVARKNKSQQRKLVS
jgi:hypothetical protein